MFSRSFITKTKLNITKHGVPNSKYVENFKGSVSDPERNFCYLFWSRIRIHHFGQLIDQTWRF
jgi:hypothetical protein